MTPGTRVEVLVCVSRVGAEFVPGEVLPKVGAFELYATDERYSVRLDGGGVVHGVKPENMRVVVSEPERAA